MNLKKAFYCAAFCFLLPAVASADPCGTELCLSDFDAAQADIESCRAQADEFFEIVKKKHGKFDAGRTLKARRDYLYKCDSGNNTDKERILAKYGMIIKPSY